MSVAAQDKPIEVLREEVIDQLIVNYGHRQLSLEAFERRLDEALNEQDHQALADLTADLQMGVDKSYAEKKKEEMGFSYSADETQEVDHMINIFGGSTRNGAWNVAKEIRMVNIFGGGEIDFSEACFSRPVVRVRMICLFAGASIYIPEGCNVISKALCIFGGVDNKVASRADANAPTIVLEGLVLFGGATIKVKKTLREKLMGLADGVKSLFSQGSDNKSV